MGQTKQLSRSKVVYPQPRSGLPTALAVAGAFIGFLFWKRRWGATRSGAGAHASPPSCKAPQASTSSLPRNKANNKNKQRNKEKRKAENEKRAAKRDAKDNDPPGADRSEPNDPNNQLVFNYTYFDPGRKDTLVPGAKRVPGQDIGKKA